MRLQVTSPIKAFILRGMQGVKVIECGEKLILECTDDGAAKVLAYIEEHPVKLINYKPRKSKHDYHTTRVICLTMDGGEQEWEVDVYYTTHEGCKGAFVDGRQVEPDEAASVEINAVELRFDNGYTMDVKVLMGDEQIEYLENEILEGGN